MAAAADQNYLENGATSADPSSLIGATNYVKALNTVAGEAYPTGYTQGVTITISGVANARTITYAP
jgi:type IV pilus assembly protein PilA